MNKTSLTLSILLLLSLGFIFKAEILTYITPKVDDSGLVDEVKEKQNQIVLIFNIVEKNIFGQDAPDDPKPQPAGKCSTCNGTGKVRQGDGHITDCVACDGKGYTSTQKANHVLTDFQIDQRYNALLNNSVNKKCEDPEFCEVNF